MPRYIDADDIIDFCNTEISMLIGHKQSAAISALRRVIEITKESAIETEPASWSPQMLFDDGFGGGQAGYICPHCRQQVPYAGKYCGKCGRRVYGGEE